VLIPRPETELLAERGWTFLNSSQPSTLNLTALDFGTAAGSGIALACKCRGRGLAVDISPEALALPGRTRRVTTCRAHPSSKGMGLRPPEGAG